LLASWQIASKIGYRTEKVKGEKLIGRRLKVKGPLPYSLKVIA